MKRRLRYIIIAFSLSFLTVSILSFVSIKHFVSLIDFSNQVDHTNEVIVQLISIDRRLRELDAQEREFMITNDSAYIRHYFDKYEMLSRETSYLDRLISDNKKQQKTLVMLRTTLALRLYNFKKGVGYYNLSPASSIAQLYTDTKAMRSESYMHIDKMMSSERVLLKQRFKDKQYFQNLTSATFKYLLVIFFMLTIFLFGLMVNELLNRIAYQDELQKNLVTLENSYAEMEQIAFASSHTFRELLRKIKIFGGRLLWLRKESSDSETQRIVETINRSAEKMQMFLDELSNLADLAGEHDYSGEVDLNTVVKSVAEQFTREINDSNTHLYIHDLPTFKGNAQQIAILFKYLLIYPLKFKDSTLESRITLTYIEVAGGEVQELGKMYRDKLFYRVNLLNSHAAFTDTFVEDVFKVFQVSQDAYKLPARDFGLAIIRRIMTNHHGFVMAGNAYQDGLEFNLYFPAK